MSCSLEKGASSRRRDSSFRLSNSPYESGAPTLTYVDWFNHKRLHGVGVFELLVPTTPKSSKSYC